MASMTAEATTVAIAERPNEVSSTRPSSPPSRMRRAISRPMTSTVALIEMARASPSTPIGSTRTSIRTTLTITATTAHATGVRVSCMA